MGPAWWAGRRLPCSSPTRGRAGMTSVAPATAEHDPALSEESPGLSPRGILHVLSLSRGPAAQPLRSVPPRVRRYRPDLGPDYRAPSVPSCLKVMLPSPQPPCSLPHARLATPVDPAHRWSLFS